MTQANDKTMTYSDFNKEIKAGLPASLYLLTGPEDFLKEKCIEQARSKLVMPGLEDFNFQSFSEMPEFSLCADFVNSPPMMGDRKLLVLRKCGFFGAHLKGRTDWEELFGSLPPTVCVLLWEPDPDKKKKPSAAQKKKPANFREFCATVGVTVEFPIQAEKNLIPWIAKAAMSGGKLIDRSCASYLIANLGPDMSVLKTEMEKITAYAAGEQITRSDIDAVIIRPTEDRTFKFVDDVTNGRRDLAFACLGALRQEQGEPVTFLSLFSGQLLTTYKAKLLLGEGLSRSEVVKRLGGLPFVAAKHVSRAATVSEEWLEGLISLCRDADRDIKQGKVDSRIALDLIVAQSKKT